MVGRRGRKTSAASTVWAGTWLCLLAVSTLSSGCRGESSDAVVDRLWISEIPRSGRANFVAFALSSQKGRSFGVVHDGSLYRGSHRALNFKQLAPGRFELLWLQEQRKARVEAEKCRPSAGFDYCVVMRGMGFGATRFQSRKRWRLRITPGKKPLSSTEIWNEAQSLLQLQSP